MCDEDTRDGAGDGRLEFHCQSAAAAGPGESALNDPAPGQDLEARGSIAALDDLDGRAVELAQRVRQFVAGIGAVGKQVAQPGIKALTPRREAKTLEKATSNLKALELEPTAESPAECVADKGYHARAVLKDLEDSPWKM